MSSFVKFCKPPAISLIISEQAPFLGAQNAFIYVILTHGKHRRGRPWAIASLLNINFLPLAIDIVLSAPGSGVNRPFRRSG